MTAIDDTTFAELHLFGQYAAGAYCPSNTQVADGDKKLPLPSRQQLRSRRSEQWNDCLQIREVWQLIPVHASLRPSPSVPSLSVANDNLNFLQQLPFRKRQST